MTEQQITEAPEGRRNPFLAVLGVLALVVAAWGLAGGPNITDSGAVPWTILVIGLVVGVGLVASGIRRR
ncbi:hypothetical protein [Gordonia sp. (in: high G+C Gram-positive bacteria)]|uniref:hypothetical protein n=1 Tax=Gordonia sp. (in: high G+C Gram-positive bacteria) TaxID=84139 RepID=UPI003F9C3B56